MYQQNQQNFIQRNVEVIKNFYKSPVFLIIGILFLPSCIFTAVSSAIMVPSLLETLQQNPDIDTQTYELLSLIYKNPLQYINIGTVATAVIYILLFVFAKKSGDKIKVPVTILKIFALIGFIVSCIALGLLVILALVLVILGIVLQNEVSTGSLADIPAGGLIVGTMYVLAVVLVFLAVLLFLQSFSQLKYSNSVRKSLFTPTLYNNGAVLFAVTTLIYSVIQCLTMAVIPAYFEFLNSLMVSLGSGSINYNYDINAFTVLSTIVAVITNVLISVMAIKYAGYIKNEKNKIPEEAYIPQYTEIKPFCKNCGFQAREEDSFCMNCGAPLEK